MRGPGWGLRGARPVGEEQPGVRWEEEVWDGLGASAYGEEVDGWCLREGSACDSLGAQCEVLWTHWCGGRRYEGKWGMGEEAEKE